MMQKDPTQFRVLRDWTDFLERWSLCETQPEAVGLLYAGPNIPGDKAQKSMRLRFYIKCALIDSVVGQAAAQVIVKQWMSFFKSAGSLEPQAHLNLVEHFLLTIDQKVLAEAPYPGFIQTYLSGLWNGLDSRSTNPEAKELQGHMAPVLPRVVRASIIWGASQTLAKLSCRTFDRAVITRSIEEYFKEKGIDLKQYLRFGLHEILREGKFREYKSLAFLDLHDRMALDQQAAIAYTCLQTG